MFLFVELRERPTNTLGEIVATEFGNRLRKERAERYWSVNNFLDHSGIDTTDGYISQIEAGTTIPSIILMIKIARAYEIDTRELFELYKQAYLDKINAKLEKAYTKARINLGLPSEETINKNKHIGSSFDHFLKTMKSTRS